MTETFDELKRICEQGEFDERCKERIEKAERVTPKMLSTFTFFYHWVVTCVISMRLPEELESLFYREILPGYYIQKMANKQQLAEDRNRLHALEKKLLRRFEARDGPFGKVDEKLCQLLEKKGRECAGLFVRASSCVEGRNSRLELHHRSSRRMSTRKLRALTVVHNFFLKRKNRTTAAERFFGKKPDKLFEYPVEKMPKPKRPAARRKQG